MVVVSSRRLFCMAIFSNSIYVGSVSSIFYLQFLSFFFLFVWQQLQLLFLSGKILPTVCVHMFSKT